jgi:hypothetical protein
MARCTESSLPVILAGSSGVEDDDAGAGAHEISARAGEPQSDTASTASAMRNAQARSPEREAMLARASRMINEA